MKFRFKNLGVIRDAELELGQMTIVCGRNNTGKTYVSYAVYWFLRHWRHGMNFPKILLNSLIKDGKVSVPVKQFIEDFKASVSEGCSRDIHKVFGANKKSFKDTRVNVDADIKADGFNLKISMEKSGASGKLEKSPGHSDARISLIKKNGTDESRSRHLVGLMASNAMRNLFSENRLPTPYIASAERTGAVLFQRGLDFTNERVIALMKDKDINIPPGYLLGNFSADYPIPVREDIDFIRSLPDIVDEESVFRKKRPEVLQRFKDIVGGEYTVSEFGHIQFIPTNEKSVKLEMTESSSAARSLLDLAFYLKHIAQPGDLLIVDEPELNLHPHNQRLVARLFATLVNHGIKVFMTTHSDYIVKELNTLIRLNQPNNKRLAAIAEREGYEKSELLSTGQLKVYMTQESPTRTTKRQNGAKQYTLVKADIDAEMGIDAVSFDETIDDLNRIEDEIIWG